MAIAMRHSTKSLQTKKKWNRNTLDSTEMLHSIYSVVEGCSFLCSQAARLQRCTHKPRPTVRTMGAILNLCMYVNRCYIIYMGIWTCHKLPGMRNDRASEHSTAKIEIRLWVKCNSFWSNTQEKHHLHQKSCWILVWLVWPTNLRETALHHCTDVCIELPLQQAKPLGKPAVLSIAKVASFTYRATGQTLWVFKTGLKRGW